MELDYTKLGMKEEVPTGEATVTSTGMHRDRDSIDDFEHVDRESSSAMDKSSKDFGEFDIGKPFIDMDMPKQNIEANILGAADPSKAFEDDWATRNKKLIDSSGLEDFLRNEKGFMSSELNSDSAQDEFNRDVPQTSLIDIAKGADEFTEQLFGGQGKVGNENFIATEAFRDSDKEHQGIGRHDGVSTLKTDSGLGLPTAADKVPEKPSSQLFDDDFLHDSLPSAKSAIAEKVDTEDLGPTSFVNEPAKPIDPFFELENIPSKQPEPTYLPSKQLETKDSILKQEKFEEPLIKESNNPPVKQKEPIDLPLKQEPDLPPSAPAKKSDPIVPAVSHQEPTKVEEVTVKAAKEVTDEIPEPMELFCKMGLDAWFKPERLHPTVVELVYWRDPKKSGAVFGTVLGVLLSLSYFSLISVIAYLSLAVLTGTIAYRIYKNIVQAVQKTSDGHPFKEILDLDLTLPQDKVRELTDMAVNHLNAAAVELRRLFLVEDLVDSIKFGVLLWCMTYVGSWFNGMTIIIIMFVAMFTLPKVYENNKTQIDQNLEIVRAKLAEVSAKVKAAVPIGKKPAEEKKEQ